MSTPADTSPATPRPPKREGGTHFVAYGIILIALAGAGYLYLHHAELTGGTVTMPAILIPVYKLLGIWGITGTVGGLGVLTLGLGIFDLVKNEAETTETAAE